jgi:hypothetical protein
MVADSRWWACDCCRCLTSLEASGLGAGNPFGKFQFGVATPDCALCTVNIVHLKFVNEAIAKHYVGVGNYVASGPYFVTDDWVLFNDDGLGVFTRTAGRPNAFSVTTEPHPDDPDRLVPTIIDLNDGEFIWERQSDDPDDPDFTLFKQTTGEKLKSGEGHHWCLGIEARTVRVGYVWETGASHDFTVTVSAEGADACDTDLDLTMCMHNEAPDASIDGWNIAGGSWTWNDNDGGPDCLKGGTLQVSSTDGGVICGDAAIFPLGGIGVRVGDNCNGGSAVLSFAWKSCNHDPRECPTVGDFELVFESTCTDGTLESIACEADCADSCAPDECPAAFCKWQWNTDTHEWDLV